MKTKASVPKIRFKGFIDAWEQRKVGELGEVITGSTPSTSHEEYYSADGIPWVTPTDIIENVIYDTPRKLSDEGQKVGRVVPKNTILITCIASIGKNAILGTMGSFNQQINGLVPDFNMFVPYFLFTESTLWSEKMKRQAAAGTMQIVNKTEFSELETRVPNYQEQEKIGAFFSNLDSLITLHQCKLDELLCFKQSMLAKMFPKKGADKPEIRFKGFTDDWEQRKFSELTDIRSAARVHKEEWQTSGVPFYRSSDVMAALNGTENEKAFISEELYEKLSAVSGKLEKGDVLVTGGGSVGKPYIVPNNEPLYTKDADLLWIKNNELLDPYFIYTFFFSTGFKDYLSSVSHVGTIAHYTITQLGETPITLPNVSEQQRIGLFFQNLDNLITLYQRKLKKLHSLKKSMLNKMFVN